MIPITSLEPHRSSSVLFSASLLPYSSAFTISKSLGPSLSLVLKVRASRLVEREVRRE
jgi:hypothetical protein